MKKARAPIQTADEKKSVVNKAEIKGTGFNREIVQSEKGKVMLEKQRDSRRQRHISALKESTKFVDQFYDNFSEKKNGVRNHSAKFIEKSDFE